MTRPCAPFLTGLVAGEFFAFSLAPLFGGLLRRGGVATGLSRLLGDSSLVYSSSIVSLRCACLRAGEVLGVGAFAPGGRANEGRVSALATEERRGFGMQTR